jgi:DNA primase
MFTFVERIEGVDFFGALKTLAERAGVELTPTRGDKDKNERSREFEILEDATIFFENELKKNELAQAYVASRGIAPSTVQIMRMGYAPAEWRSLRTYLKARGWSDGEMEKTGLIKRTDKQTSDPFYDVFRDRVVFPIADASGRVVAFSGRIVVDDPKAPKYLNSPETDLYRKSRILYGLDKAKQRIREMDYAILVEGQMD